MKVVWAHDNIFYNHPISKATYSRIEFPYENWLRYLGAFEKVTILSRQQNLDINEDLSTMNISSGENVEFIGLPNLNTPINLVLERKEAINRIRETLSKADAVIARLPSTIGNITIQQAIKLGKPYAVELVGCPSDALNGLKSLKGKIYAPILTNSTRKNVYNASHVMYVTEEFLQRRYPTKGKSIACSNVKLNFPGTGNFAIPRLSKIDANNYCVNIGLIGYLSPYKGIDTALKALKILSPKYPNIRLNILGNGDEDYWESYASNLNIDKGKLKISTIKSKEKLEKWFGLIDIYIQPSRTEGLPRGLIEAMSQGCPSIASRVGGIPELLREEFLHNPEDYSKLASLVENLIINKDLYKKSSEENFVKSKKYNYEFLEENRRGFWEDFSKYVMKNYESI